MLPGEVGRVGLGRPDHVPRADPASSALGHAGRDRIHSRRLVDDRARPLGRCGQPANQAGRLNSRAVRSEQRSQPVLDPEPRAELARRRAATTPDPLRAIPVRRPARHAGGRAGARSGRAVSDPPCAQSQSIPSRAMTSPTSATVAWIAAAIARGPPGPPRRRQPAAEPESLPSTQPPLRPEAPNPTCSASSTTTARPGSARRNS